MKNSSAMPPDNEVFGKAVRIEREGDDPKSALLAKLMDTVFVIPGTKIRFGFDTLIGVFPGVGDSIGAIISTYIIAQASRMGVPRIILVRMAMHILINTLVGAVPILGDIFSVFYRANVKNYELLRRYADHRRAPGAGDWFFVVTLAVLILLVLTGLIVGAIYLVRKVISMW